MARLSVTISDDLRAAIEDARDANTMSSIFRRRSLSEEVEELLRIALDRRERQPFLLLKMDEGIWAWLRAHARGIGLAGSMEDTAIYMIRCAIVKDFESKTFRAMMAPFLPPSIQRAIGWSEPGGNDQSES